MQDHYTLQDVEQKLETLRTRWVHEPDKRWLFERQARLLKIALDIKIKKQDKQQQLLPS